MRTILLLLLSVGIILHAQAIGGGKTIKLNGKQYTLHQMKAGESLYGIAKAYEVDLTALMEVNRITESDALSVNTLLIIPMDVEEKLEEETVLVETTPAPMVNGTPKKTHVVDQGETFFSIARKYGIAPKELQTANSLENFDLKIGQELVIPTSTETPVKVVSGVITPPTPAVKDTTATLVSIIEPVDTSVAVVKINKAKLASEKLKSSLASDNVTTKTSLRGIATWAQDGRADDGQMFALYSDAPAGSVLQIKHLLNGKVAYVKVLGPLPANDKRNNSILKLSSAAARYLGVLDDRFLIEMIVHPAK